MYRSVTEVTLADVVNAFPLRDSKYILRIRYKDCWLDLPRKLENNKCMHVNGKIYLKALRLPVGVDPKIAYETGQTPRAMN